MFKNAIFQLHWFFGITAGLVLAVVGVTGALLSFQQPLLKAFNPGVLSVRADGRTVLTPEELLARVQAAQPKRKPVSLTLSGDPSEPAKVGFAPGSAFGAGGEGHLRMCYLKDLGPLEEALGRFVDWMRKHGPV